jgi:hypothetical protein
VASTVPPPHPTEDEESAPYWAGLAEHRLRLQRCTACGRTRFPPMPGCPWCAATSSTVIESSGAGRVYSWVTVHRSLTGVGADEVPYVIAAVELAEGCRIFARVDAPPAAIRAGAPVAASFVDHDGWTELRYVPATEPA